MSTGVVRHNYEMGNNYSSTAYAPRLSLMVSASDYTTIEEARHALARFLRRFADELEQDNSLPGWVREMTEGA